MTNQNRPAVVVAALDIGQTNALAQMLSATGRFLAQPAVANHPHYADARRCHAEIVALLGQAGEKLSVQLGLEQWGLEDQTGKPLLVLGATDSARALLGDLDVAQWLALELADKEVQSDKQ